MVRAKTLEYLRATCSCTNELSFFQQGSRVEVGWDAPGPDEVRFILHSN